jgi:hypothetical protein
METHQDELRRMLMPDHNPFLSYRLIVAVSLLVAACSHLSPALPDKTTNLERRAGNLDSEFDRIGRSAPSFVALYLDDAGVYHARIRDPSDREAVQRAVGAFILASGTNPDQNRQPTVLVDLVTTRYTWNEVSRFKEMMRDALSLPDTTFLDADEMCACVTVGVTKESAGQSVLEFAKQRGIPSDAVNIAPAAARRDFLANVQDSFRPLFGGIQIKTDGISFGWPLEQCTIAIVGDRLAVPGFLTASHCTRSLGVVDGTKFWQDGRDFFGGDYVAHESADPAWSVIPGCPSGRVCRRSDAAFAVVDIGNQNVEYLTVARPAVVCSNRACSLDHGNVGCAHGGTDPDQDWTDFGGLNRNGHSHLRRRQSGQRNCARRSYYSALPN